jgi:hypothetical protein
MKICLVFVLCLGTMLLHKTSALDRLQIPFYRRLLKGTTSTYSLTGMSRFIGARLFSNKEVKRSNRHHARFTTTQGITILISPL